MKLVWEIMILCILLLGLVVVILEVNNFLQAAACTDDCCYPNNCPYNEGCVTKQDRNYCINPTSNISYMDEIEQGLKQEDWELRER